MSTYDSIIAKGKAQAKEEFMSTYDSIISQGISQGEVKAKITGIIKSLKIGKLSIEDIADTFEVTVEYVLKIKKENKL